MSYVKCFFHLILGVGGKGPSSGTRLLSTTCACLKDQNVDCEEKTHMFEELKFVNHIFLKSLYFDRNSFLAFMVVVHENIFLMTQTNLYSSLHNL